MDIKAYRELREAAEQNNLAKGADLIADIERRLREQETWEIRHPIASIILMVGVLAAAMAVIVGFTYLGYGIGL